MKKQLLLLCIIFCLYFPKAFSQDFLGLSTGNYSGITGVSLQPASIVDSRFKFDINLFSSDVNYSNNYFLLNRSAILKFNKNNFDNYATFKDNYLSEGTLTAGQKVFFNINNRTQLPLSFMATTGKKSAIALNMQFRTVIQGRGISQDLAHTGFNNFNPSTNNPTIDASGGSINSLSWAEVGLTYGRVLYSSGKSFLKVAITGKYLGGLSSVSLSSNNLQMGVNGDSTFNFNSPNVSYNHNQNADFNKLFDKNFTPNANSIGFDAGLVYEYRGNLDKFKYIKNDDEASHDALRRDVSKYIFKLGVSLLDVGMFKFDKPTDVNSFSADINNWDIRNAHYNSLNEFDTALATRVVANPNDPNSYNVYLPTALSGQLDVKFVKGLFLNVMSYWPVNLGSAAGKRFTNYGFYTITPRYETRHFGIYIPYTAMQRNDLTNYKQYLLGATLRAGPFFIGSSNLLSMAFKENLPAADVHIGFKVGITYGKPDKSNEFINKLVKRNHEAQSREYEDNYSDSTKTKDIRKKENYVGRSDTSINNRLILDYKNGKVYYDPAVKQNVIIINNSYYYGNAPTQTRIDSVSVQNGVPKYYADSLNAQTLEIASQQNKLMADSISKITTDSLKIKRKQLDSLIRSMQQLRTEMDSSKDAGGASFNSRDSSNSPLAGAGMQQEANDSLRNGNDSLRSGTSKDLVTIAQGDAFEANTDNSKDISASVKKKDKSEPNLVEGKLGTAVSSHKGDTTLVERTQSPLMAANMGNQQRNREQRNDSLQRTTGASSSSAIPNQKDTGTLKLNNGNVKSLDLIEKDNFTKENDVTPSDNQRASSASPQGTAAVNGVQKGQIESNTQSPNQTQQQQNELYKRYAEQSARLESDINRLNARVSSSRGQDRVRNRIIPLPIPIISFRSRKKADVAVAPSIIKIKDTVYLRDTITILKKDTIRNLQVDKINLIPSATMKPTIIKEMNPNVIVVKKTNNKPGFDYTSMPEENILFALNKSTIQPIYNKRLNYIAGILQKNPDLQVIVTGHTDSTGSKAINEKLSLQRAEAVSYYLMNNGISKKQITVKSLTFEKPAVTGHTKAARSQNRRVALKFASEEQ